MIMRELNMMMLNPNAPQRTILDLFKSQKITLSAEIIPPRNGTEVETILQQIKILSEVPVDFISVTKGAGGSLRGGTLPIAQVIKDRFGICSLAHFTCRDFTISDIENALMDHQYVGITNILALRGDPPDGQPDHFKPAPNRHSYAWQLVDQISKLNAGQYLARTGFDQPNTTQDAIAYRAGTPTTFCIGVAAHPEQEPFSDAVEFFTKKIKTGASYGITQMIFSAEPYARFLEGCAKKGVHAPVLPGLRIITQKETAERMIKKFGVKIPQALIDKLGSAKDKTDARKIGFDFTLHLAEKLIELGAPGIHIFVMNDAVSGAELLKSLK